MNLFKKQKKRAKCTRQIVRFYKVLLRRHFINEKRTVGRPFFRLYGLFGFLRHFFTPFTPFRQGKAWIYMALFGQKRCEYVEIPAFYGLIFYRRRPRCLISYFITSPAEGIPLRYYFSILLYQRKKENAIGNSAKAALSPVCHPSVTRLSPAQATEPRRTENAGNQTAPR